MACQACGEEVAPGARFCAHCGATQAESAVDSSDDPFIGQTLGGRYVITKRIGEGGMGVVYAAEQTLGSTVRKVAVKTLHAELSRDPAITARFHREVGTVAHLEHPNTVRVYDFGTADNGVLYIAMEFLDGVPLSDVIQRQGRLRPARIAHILHQVAGSLGEAHSKAIVHRDLKPENVLLVQRAGESDVVKLVDFGIAARTESADRRQEQKLTQQGMVLGTPPYMSPEQFTGEALDARSDIYSLGVMTYEMVTGQLPFEADTPWQWATHHMTTRPTPPSELSGDSSVPEAISAVLLKALEKRPEDRFSSVREFYDAFATAAGAASSQATAAHPVATGAVAFQATQAMDQMPVAAPGVAPTAAMPAAHDAPTPPSAVAMARPAPGQPARSKTPFVLLGSVAACLALAMAFFGLREDSSSAAAPGSVDEAPAEVDLLGTQPAPSQGAPSAGTTENEDESAGSATSDPPDPTPEKPAPTQPEPKPKPKPRPAPKPKPRAEKPKPTAPPAKPAPVTPAPVPVPAPVPPSPAVDHCDRCQSQVSTDLRSAATHYAQCTDSAAKRRCRTRAAQLAPKMATRAAFNQKCQEAKVIVEAGKAMGVPASRFSKATKACP